MLQEIIADYCEWVSEMYGTPGKQSLWFGYIFTWLQITFLKVFFIVGETTFRFSNENNILTLIRSVRNVFLLVFKTFFQLQFLQFSSSACNTLCTDSFNCSLKSTVARNSRQTNLPQANWKAEAKQKSHGKTKKSSQNKKQQQSKKGCCKVVKMLRQNKKVRAKQKSYGERRKHEIRRFNFVSIFMKECVSSKKVRKLIFDEECWVQDELIK